MKQIQFISISPEENNAPVFAYFDKKIEELKKHFKPKEPEKNLSRKQVCEMLQVDMSTLHNWKHKGILVPLGIGGRVIYRRSDIEAKLIELA